MRVAPQVAIELLDAREGALGVDHPVGGVERRLQVGDALASRLELAVSLGALQAAKEAGPEATAEHLDRQQVARPPRARHPARPALGEPTRGHDQVGRGRSWAIIPSQGWPERQPPARPASPRPRPAWPRRRPRRVRSASLVRPRSPRDMYRACGGRCGGVLDRLRPPAGAGRCLGRRGLYAIDA